MKVSRATLDFALALGRSHSPEEFVGFLRERDGVVSDVVLPPQSESNRVQVFYREESLPIDTSVVGTVHSHPNGTPRPSSTDLQLFSRKGEVHVIVAGPFGRDDWRAFDAGGRELELEVVEIDLDERWREEFRDIEGFLGGRV